MTCGRLALGLFTLAVALPTSTPVHGQSRFVGAANVAIENPRTDACGEPQPELRKKGGEAVAVFDVNADGFQDFVVVNGTNYYHVVLGGRDPQGGPTFTALEPAYIGEVGDEKSNVAKGLGLHDFNADGLLDLYLGTTGKGTLQADDPRDLRNIANPDNVRRGGLCRDGGFRTQFAVGDGTFEHRDVGIEPGGTTRAGVFADFDGDGAFDLLDSNAPYFGIWWNGSPEPNRLLVGQTDGTFGDNVLPKAVTNDPGDLWVDELDRANKDFKGIVVRDFDRDGLPDVILSAYADVWDNVAIPPLAPADPAGALVDLDADGFPDGGYQGDWDRGILVLRNASEPGDIAFEDVSETAIDQALGGPDRMHVYVTVPADIDGDADLDLLVSGPRNYTAHASLAAQTPMVQVYRNDSSPGSLRFTNVSDEAGVGFMNDDDALSAATNGLYPALIPGFMADGGAFEMRPLLSSAAAIDIDNDGDPDWIGIDRQYLPENPATGETFTLWVFENDGMGRFRLLSPSEHGMQNTARDISYGDLDGDGRVDVVAVNGSGGGQVVDDANYVYLNNTQNENGHVFVNALSAGNPHGIGAKITIYEAGRERVLGYEEVRTDFAYRSKRSARLHFGVGEVDQVDIQIERRGGNPKLWSTLEVNREYWLAEVVVDVESPSVTIYGLRGVDMTEVDVGGLRFTPGDLSAAGSPEIGDFNEDGIDDLRIQLPDGAAITDNEALCVEARTSDGVLLDGCEGGNPGASSAEGGGGCSAVVGSTPVRGPLWFALLGLGLVAHRRQSGRRKSTGTKTRDSIAPICLVLVAGLILSGCGDSGGNEGGSGGVAGTGGAGANAGTGGMAGRGGSAGSLVTFQGTVVVLTRHSDGHPRQVGMAAEPSDGTTWRVNEREPVYFWDGPLARELEDRIGEEVEVIGTPHSGLDFLRTVFIRSYKVGDTVVEAPPTEDITVEDTIEGTVTIVDRYEDDHPRTLGVSEDGGGVVRLIETNKSRELRYRIGRRMRLRGRLESVDTFRVGAYEELDGSPEVTAGDGFRLSFLAGGHDENGNFMGGVEIDTMAAFDGKIFAGVSYRRNTETDSIDPAPPGAQVLVLEEPNGRWKVDFTVGPGEAGPAPRIVFLKPVLFESDGTGAPLEPPVELLAAVGGNGEVYLRSPGDPVWVASGVAPVVQANIVAGARPESRSVTSHSDSVTGVSYLLVGSVAAGRANQRQGGGGVYAGTYDASLPGLIAWAPQPEFPFAPGQGEPGRVTGLTSTDGIAYATAGLKLVRRTDGASPEWTEIFFDDQTPGNDSLREARGVTGPDGAPSVLTGIEGFNSRVVRIDPALDDVATVEIEPPVSIESVFEVPTLYGIVAYNGPETRALPGDDEAVIMGFEVLRTPGPPDVSADATIGRYYEWTDGLLLWRESPTDYYLSRIVDETLEVDPPLVGPRTILTNSPFPGEENVIYVGGFDHNGHLHHNTGWIFKVHLDDVRGEPLVALPGEP